MRRNLVLCVVVVVVGGLVCLGLALIPQALVDLDLGSGRLTSNERVTAVNAARTTVLQAFAGGLVLLGALGAWRQVQVGREAQLTERYTRGIEQLASNDRTVRIGGIYALERIARDSPGDRTTVSEVLTSFVRERAVWQQRHPQHAGTEDPHGPGSAPAQVLVPLDELPYLRFRAPDVQAAMTVLGRRPRQPQGAPPLDLRDADLRRGNLSGADLRGANLRGAHLEGLRLEGAHLESVNLSRSHLHDANLKGAHLEGADLREADLRGAHFLSTAHLAGAKAWRTTWPATFDPARAGVREAPPG